MMIVTKVTEFDVETTVDSSQYWQGAGLAYTDYTDLATGMGQTEADALNDALEMLAQSGEDWNVADVERRIRADIDESADMNVTVCDATNCDNVDAAIDCGCSEDDCDTCGADDDVDACDGCETQYFVTIRVR